jgi:hypothetical protein
MKIGTVAALILLGFPAAALAQRPSTQSSARDVPSPVRTPADAEPGSGQPRDASPWNNQAETDTTPKAPPSPYGNGIRTPWQDNPIRTPWQ